MSLAGVKWIPRYLRGSSNVCLEFGGNYNMVIGFVDTNYVGDLDQRRSLIRYVFTIRGSALSWKATLHHSIVLSTAGAEYLAIIEALREALCLKDLCGEICA